MTAPAELDPFAGAEKAPAISFKNKPIGTVITVLVTESAKKVQGKEYGKDTPAVWMNKDGSTSPKYSAVINGTVDGEPHSVWATIPSDLFAKIADAQKQLRRSIAPGDTLAIKFTAEEPTSGDPKKIYAVKITPGAPPPAADPFSGGSSDDPPF